MYYSLSSLELTQNYITTLVEISYQMSKFEEDLVPLNECVRKNRVRLLSYLTRTLNGDAHSASPYLRLRDKFMRVGYVPEPV
jgi:hypothetical protein